MTDSQEKVSNADLVDRLARLRAILPMMAGDLAAARRRSNALEAENDRLNKRINELESKLGLRRTAGAAPRRRGSPRAVPSV